MNRLLFAVIISNFLICLNSSTDVIWNKELHIFTPLFNIPIFNAMKEKTLTRSRNFETHDFNGENLKIVYYEEKNIFMFQKNNTKISGTCGQLWTILSEYLNFTLVPVSTIDRGFGTRHQNNSYTGLLGIMQRKEAQIIPRSGIYSNRLHLMEYTVPLWTTRYRLFIRPEWKYDEEWVFHIFSTNVWISTLAIFIILSVAGYTLQKMANISFANLKIYSMQDHFFYTMVLMLSQGTIPDHIYNRFKIITLCKSFFSWMILIALSAHSITRMMNRKLIPPFSNVQSLINDTTYDIIAFQGSMVREKFEKEISPINLYNKKEQRIFLVRSSKIMYDTACFSTSKYALFDAEDRQKAIGRNLCRLIPTGASYYETWIASGVVRGFKYKRSLDIGLMKLNEFGLTDGLKDRWMNWKNEEKIENHFVSIDISQVYLIFIILFSGMLASFFIAFLEYLTYKTNTEHKLQLQNINIQCERRKLFPLMKFKRTMMSATKKKLQLVTHKNSSHFVLNK